MRRPVSYLALLAAVALIYLFMLGPILITAVVSFNRSDRSYFPPRGLSLHWWGAAFTPQWTGAFVFSLELAALSAIATTIAGLPLALAFRSYEFPGKAAIQAMTLGPLVLPSLVTGIALLQFLTLAGLGSWIGLPALLIGHVVICLPFSVRTIAISLASIPVSAELAAASLGASPGAVLREITLPLARSGVGAGMIFAFISSFDDVNLALFVSSPRQTPITVQIMQFLEFGFSPTLAALSILSMLVPLALVALCGRVVGIGGYLQQEQGHA
ncbi:MAG: ABC transporter permease [Acidisphaera sp.]|nr:ABC transporter permease [Acidisphaera sp.]